MRLQTKHPSYAQLVELSDLITQPGAVCVCTHAALCAMRLSRSSMDPACETCRRDNLVESIIGNRDECYLLTRQFGEIDLGNGYHIMIMIISPFGHIEL
jgi:hypothetical protein